MKIQQQIKLDRGAARDIIAWTNGEGTGVRQVVGMRGLEVQEKRGGGRLVPIQNKPWVYNDGVITIDFEAEQAYVPRYGTVDPGWYYTAHPMRPGGAAHLVNGMYLYKPGLHGGKPAFRQAGPVRINRDKNRNGIIDPSEKWFQSGWFAINIHAGGIWRTYKGRDYPIGKWSAGCMNVAGKGGWLSPVWIEFRDFLYEVYAKSEDPFSAFVCNYSDVFGAPRVSPAATSVYVVQDNDTLWRLARKFTGGDITALLALNKQSIENPDLIHRGDKIIVPAGSAAA